MRPFGFTLIELLVTLSITSILLSVGIPNLTGHIQNLRTKTATRNLLDSLELARSQAVFSNKRMTMRKLGSWEEGWDVFIDHNNDGVLNSNERIVEKHEKLTGVRVIANRPVRNYVSFVESGEGRTANGTNSAGGFLAGTFSICPREKGRGYQLILARGGRVRIQDISAEECSTH